MMNALAIALITASLASAGLWSPPPSEDHDDVLVKEGHRVVVIEYDQDGQTNTKVSISPDHNLLYHEINEDAADHTEKSGHHGPKEWICDAFGKCRHKIASMLGRAKEEAAEKVHEAEEAIKEKIGKLKEEVSQKTHEAQDSIRNKVDNAKDAAKDAVRTVKEGVSESAREDVRETARVMKAVENVRSNMKRMKDFGERHLRWHLGLDALSGLLNLMGFVTAYGMCVWVTFLSSYVLASALPRHQSGLVQSKIYPVYFQAMLYNTATALLGHLLSQRKLLITSRPDVLQAYNLLSTLLTVLINMLYLEPRPTKVMMEKEEGRGRDLGTETTKQGIDITRIDGAPPVTEMPATEREGAGRRLNEKLRKFNSFSSLLNLMSLMALTWYLVYLSQRLAMTC